MDLNIFDNTTAFDKYSREINLPVYPQLTNEEVDMLLEAVEEAVGQFV